MIGSANRCGDLIFENMVREKRELSLVRIDAVAGRAKTLSIKAFRGLATKWLFELKDSVVSQRMASGQTHVNIRQSSPITR